MIVNLSTAVLAVSASAATATLMTTSAPIVDVRPATAIAGFVGAVITILVQKPVGARETLGTMVSGTACAIYLTPYVAGWFGFTDERAIFAFVLGIAGIYVCRRVIDLIQNPDEIVNAIRNRDWASLLTTTPRPVATVEVTKVVVDTTGDAPTRG